MSDELFSTKAEISVLSLILNNPELIFKTNGMKSSMLSSTSHNIIFSTMVDLREENLRPELSLVKLRLESSGKLNNVGGMDYLEYLFNQKFDERNFEEFVRIVIESYKAQALLSLSSSVRLEHLNLDNIGSEIQRVKAGLDTLTETATSNNVAHIGELTQTYYKEFIERIEHPGIRGVPWGIDKIDKISGGKSAGEFWILAGRPGSGKTAMLCNTALHDGITGTPTLVISREMSYTELIERFIPIYTGIPITNLRLGVGIKKDELESVRLALKKLSEMPIYIDTNYSGMSEYYLESVIRRHHTLYGIKTLYVDYVQLLAERDDNQTAALGRISRSLKLLSQSLRICTVLLSQLNREVEHRENKRPVLSDLRQSGNLEEDADWVVALYRDFYYDRNTKDKDALEFIILKARNGPVGMIPLKFITENNKITGEE